MKEQELLNGCCCGDNPFFTTHTLLKCSNPNGSYCIRSIILEKEKKGK